MAVHNSEGPVDSSVYLVVMAGGSGTRFWPKSTSRVPKQLLSFGGSNENALSLLQQTTHRFEGWVPPKQCWVVTTEALASAVHTQLPNARVLAEPQGRNTAPCVYWAAKEIEKLDPNGVMLVMPADHYIPNQKAFVETVKRAVIHAKNTDSLVTLGVRPTRAETGYGYLKLPTAEQAASTGAVPLEAFVEKPNQSKAEHFFQSGQYLWNGGMFVWSVSSILRAFQQYMPEFDKAWVSSEGKVEKAYPTLTATSIDYGIMEKAKNAVTFVLDCGWDDLGSWTSLESVAGKLTKVESGNVLSSGDLISIESEGNIVDVPGNLVALLGVKDLIVVQAGKSLLVADKKLAQDIRKVVDQVKARRPELA